MNSGEITIVTIATGNYHRFIEKFVESCNEYVANLNRIFILTEQLNIHNHPKVTYLPLGPLDWPFPTLFRYHALLPYKSYFTSSKYVLHIDIDTNFVNNVQFNFDLGLIAVEHPGYVAQIKSDLPYERNPQSNAFISTDEGFQYFCGGVQGGTVNEYFDAVTKMISLINADWINGIIPKWHDESIWNKFLVTYPHINILPSPFLMPENMQRPDTKIIALDKNHNRIRKLKRKSFFIIS